MRTFYKLTIIYITITFVLIGFFISSNVSFLNKPITLNYNKFRIEYADIINTIKNRETSFNSTKLSKLLDTKEVQLCLYDLTTDDIFYKYGSYVSNIDKSNLELYMVHDHGIAKSIDSSKYLLNFIYFNENKPSILGIFVVNRDILFSELNKDKIALSHNILGFIVVCVIITFCYILLLLFKIIIPMKQLESITKTISNGDFHKDISYRLQQGSLGKCYTELEHMRKNLLNTLLS